jgi:hypothetical protein
MKKLALLAILFSGTFAFAGPTAGELHDMCRAYQRYQAHKDDTFTPTDRVNITACSHYIVGVLDGFILARDASKNPVPYKPQENEASISAVITYLDEHPEVWKYSASSEIINTVLGKSNAHK